MLLKNNQLFISPFENNLNAKMSTEHIRDRALIDIKFNLVPATEGPFLSWTIC